uniref:Glycosyltransferase family 92 protein n=1 Tax=Xenopus tropicalis TaxID=8364 RepID=A0A1B8Y6C1_XENTR|eukprot:XP_002942012.1 PREDICTED: uncharacterized protein LOC100495391 [Xenopus tropicalis]
MNSLGRFRLFACTVGITCFVLSFNPYRWQNLWHLVGTSMDPLPTCRGQLAEDTITPLKDHRTFIIAPYVDNRERNIIRILGIVHTEVKELYCYFCCAKATVLQHKAEIDIHVDRFGFPYGLADIICAEPPDCRVAHVALDGSPTADFASLTVFPIRNREPGVPTANFTVCISAMFGNYSNVLQFIQTIEMYKILGTQKVTVYLNNCSRQMEEVLQYYTEEGTVEVIPWHIQRYLKVSHNWQYPDDGTEIGYYGQISALNDCLYRNMYSSKFVVLNDQDEIILPFKHRTWDTMMESLQRENPNVGIFLFENHLFPHAALTDGNFPDTSRWNGIPGFNLLRHTLREPNRPDHFNSRKMIMDPRAVIQTSVHSVLKQYKDSMFVSLESAMVYHCRDSQQEHLNRSSLIEDTNIWRFNETLIRNVNDMLNRFLK